MSRESYYECSRTNTDVRLRRVAVKPLGRRKDGRVDIKSARLELNDARSAIAGFVLLRLALREEGQYLLYVSTRRRLGIWLLYNCLLRRLMIPGGAGPWETVRIDHGKSSRCSRFSP